MNNVNNWQGYLDEDGGRRPGHLVLYPIEVGTQINFESFFPVKITFLGVSSWRSLLGSGLLPGHICSHPRN